jgi:hypothetical protein
VNGRVVFFATRIVSATERTHKNKTDIVPRGEPEEDRILCEEKWHEGFVPHWLLGIGYHDN